MTCRCTLLVRNTSTASRVDVVSHIYLIEEIVKDQILLSVQASEYNEQVLRREECVIIC